MSLLLLGLEDVPEATYNTDEWRDRIREICARDMFIYIYIYIDR